MLKTFALIFGVVFLAVGAAGFIPALVQPPAGGHELAVEHGHGMLLGLFPVNTVHNIAHLLFGAWGLLSAGSAGAARGYFRGVAIIYGLLTVLGLIPATATLFGLMPIDGNDVWLHLVLALAGVYFGFIHRERVAEVH